LPLVLDQHELPCHLLERVTSKLNDLRSLAILPHLVSILIPPLSNLVFHYTTNIPTDARKNVPLRIEVSNVSNESVAR
jgi:hypothetical protein